MIIVGKTVEHYKMALDQKLTVGTARLETYAKMAKKSSRN
jgi:hypothetical protein